MATIHGHGKGKSGSHPPVLKEKPVWITMKNEEIENLVLQLHKDRESKSKIGLILRDNYGIPNVKKIIGKSIMEILDIKNIKEKPEDLMNLIRKANFLKKHLEKNKRDKSAKRGLQLIESKIRRLSKYYKKKNVLIEDWKYTKERV
ncbi:30S ribosomal protein S15 [Candidatus Pacearchaeota archaeon CG_4_9_14_3_um_filter_31_7]|nr:MAG: 30S ribosomal protein S15 [Candidatus Pacearchaeota archaeon CG1_02_31_27]PIN92294.1 MAG: 30S ribosomal protein S15 [Candidatus Pacearchaeota archaeon CG10_big_fil_rev_8_21_14_0_10_31_59]PJA70979.1 MAG: 30S ribosomal protein S15 [Candidatus Pacearchaeota archaeon CG_4_9_14_3_um_filter_31_7]